MNLHRRPLILGSLSALATPGAIFAQQPASGKVWRVGVLSDSSPVEFVRSFLLPLLSPLGYVEGRNLTIDVKYAQSKPELLPGLASELVASKPDLLIGVFNRENLALKRATTTIPILMLFAAAPVEIGLIASLAQPGGNLTGNTSNTYELIGKMFGLLRETVPRMSRLTTLYERPDYPGSDIFERWSDRAVKALRLRSTVLNVQTLADIDLALAHMERDRPDAIYVVNTGVLVAHFGKVVEFAAHHKLPTLFPSPRPVRAGGLMSYGPDYSAIGLRSAWMIDKIFKGAKPSDIPVEEPTRYQLTINLKTAKAIGLTIPPTVLLQATELIE